VVRRDLSRIGNIISGVYTPVLAKGVLVMGPTPEQRCNRELESQRNKNAAPKKSGRRPMSAEAQKKLSDPAKQRWAQRKNKTKAGLIEMPVGAASPRRKGSPPP
jgi:hypothetical protein